VVEIDVLAETVTFAVGGMPVLLEPRERDRLSDLHFFFVSLRIFRAFLMKKDLCDTERDDM
jgi:hypothetical protein